MNYLSNDNKGLVWGILQESNMFDGFSDDKFGKIKQIFDNTMIEINSNYSNNSLIEKNKITVETLMSRITTEKHTISNSSSSPSKIKVVYKSEDIHNKRENELNLKLKEQESNFNKLINPSKPSDINFSDNSTDDKPIGDEMDKLIADRLASRERELEIPKMTSEGEKWLNVTNTDVPPTPPIKKNEDKRVSFEVNEINEVIGELPIKTKPEKRNVLNFFKKIQNNSNEEIDSVKNQIEELIKKQELIIKENIEMKNSLNNLLNKI